MNTLIVADAVQLAQGAISENSADGLQKIVLGIIGSLLLIVMGGRMLAAYTEERYGKMLSLIAGGVVIAGVVYAPSTVTAILRGLFQQFTGAA